jgi:hypothetical protein
MDYRTHTLMSKTVAKCTQWFLLMGALALSAFASSASISGTVVNKTTGKPSEGDEVLLIDVSADMTETARTRSNRSGHFQFHVSQGSAPRLVQVMHGGVRYESAISLTGGPLDVTVFDSTPAISDVKSSVQAMRIEADADHLRITEMLNLVNSSNPPRTIQKQQLFWLTLPPGASVLSSVAQGPREDAVESVAVALPNESRCYFNFPLRPGTTKIQLQYQVPYSGTLTFVPHIPFTAEIFGIVLPSSLQFEASEGGSYIKDSDQNGELAEVIHDVAAGNAEKFTISSATGLVTNARGNQSDSIAEVLRLVASFNKKTPDSQPASSEGNVGPHRLLWKALLPFGVLLALVVYLYRRHARMRSPISQISTLSPAESIREELFNLESARVQNRISKARYAASRAVLEKRLAAVLPGNSDHP